MAFVLNERLTALVLNERCMALVLNERCMALVLNERLTAFVLNKRMNIRMTSANCAVSCLNRLNRSGEGDARAVSVPMRRVDATIAPDREPQSRSVSSDDRFLPMPFRSHNASNRVA